MATRIVGKTPTPNQVREGHGQAALAAPNLVERQSTTSDPIFRCWTQLRSGTLKEVIVVAPDAEIAQEAAFRAYPEAIFLSTRPDGLTDAQIQLRNLVGGQPAGPLHPDVRQALNGSQRPADRATRRAAAKAGVEMLDTIFATVEAMQRKDGGPPLIDRARFIDGQIAALASDPDRRMGFAMALAYGIEHGTDFADFPDNRGFYDFLVQRMTEPYDEKIKDDRPLTADEMRASPEVNALFLDLEAKEASR